MDTITGVFTKRNFNPMSLAIRMATPISITTMAPASHVVVLDGDTGFAMEANMLHGVRRVTVEEALKGAQIVTTKHFQVQNAVEGLGWMRKTAQEGAKYDFLGALGLGLAPGRSWQDPSSWFCFEYFCMGLAVAGRPTFTIHAHVNAHMLMSLPSEYPVLTGS